MGHYGSEPSRFPHPFQLSRSQNIPLPSTTLYCPPLSLVHDIYLHRTTSRLQIEACPATHHRTNALLHLPIEIEEHVSADPLPATSSPLTRVSASPAWPFAQWLLIVFPLPVQVQPVQAGRETRQRGERADVVFFSSTLQLVRVSTWQAIGAAILLVYYHHGFSFTSPP